MKRALCALVLLLPGAGIAAPAHETFDLKVHAYCIPPAFPAAGGKVCGFDDETKLRDKVLDRVLELNLRWCPVGITFRHVSTEIVYDLWHSLTSEKWKAEDPADTSFLGGQSIRFLREHVAMQDPKSVHLFILHQMNIGFAAGPPSQAYPGEALGIFIGPGFDGGAWAHEMGHHFGLAHTFSWEDGFQALNRNLDGLGCTSDDPGVEESFDPNDGADDDKWSGTLRSGFEYCQATVVKGGADQGSPKPDYCTIQCWRNFDFIPVPLLLPDTPPIDNIMTYYGDLCHGPYVLNSIPHKAVCGEQIDIIHDRRRNTLERAILPDVCKDSGGDADCDGICQNDDKCPGTPDAAQTDGDGDGTPDSCDLCPDDPNPTGDIDGDGIGDACDPDMDGDGCPQVCPPNQPKCPGADLHPEEGTMVAGTMYHLGCEVTRSDFRVSESGDNDHDLILNCADPDDDNDRIPDDEDPCPIEAGLGCLEMAGAPCTEIPQWRATCHFGDCNEFLLQLVEAINPDPTTVLATFSDIRAMGDTIYLHALQGKTLSETAALLRPRDRERLALDLVDREGRTLARIAKWGAEDLDLGDLTTGELMALQVPEPGRGPLVVRSSWAVGSPPGAMPADGDRDGVPDSSDNCLAVANPLQDDADRDRFGDACDADLDGDLRVTEADVLAIAACLGTDLQSVPPPYCTVGAPRPVSAEPTNAPPRAACTAADLDSDGLVSERDLDLAREALGREPGPSGKRFGGRR